LFKQCLIFGAGAAAGFVAAFLLTKKKYQKIAEEEIESMRDYFSEKSDASKDKTITDTERASHEALKNEMIREKEPEKRVRTDYRKIAAEYMETNRPDDAEKSWLENPYPDMINEDHPKDDAPAENPYTITADQFVNEKRNFDKVTLLYFEENGVLCDDAERITEDIDQSIGSNNLDKFGEYEEDVAYIRNERLGIDYEVLLQHSTYKPPYPEEDDVY